MRACISACMDICMYMCTHACMCMYIFFRVVHALQRPCERSRKVPEVPINVKRFQSMPIGIEWCQEWYQAVASSVNQCLAVLRGIPEMSVHVKKY